ncbi:MAG: hypothetical protein MI923_25840 [Phycisphaerales bacterium]|nr:hypothetical protein [Phycisphaerales bacterium]
MAKFGPSETDTWNPISGDTIAALANPPAKAEAKPPRQPAAKKPDIRVIPKEPAAEPESRGGQTKEPATVVETAPAQEVVSRQPAKQSQTRLTQPIRFKVTGEQKAEIKKAIARLGATLGTDVNFSQVTRCLWELYLNHEDDVLDRFGRAGSSLRRPSNSDAQGIAQFEDAMTSIIDAAVAGGRRRQLK